MTIYQIRIPVSRSSAPCRSSELDWCVPARSHSWWKQTGFVMQKQQSSQRQIKDKVAIMNNFEDPSQADSVVLFEPRDYILMQWYVPVLFLLVVILASKWIVQFKQTRKADASNSGVDQKKKQSTTTRVVVPLQPMEKIKKRSGSNKNKKNRAKAFSKFPSLFTVHNLLSICFLFVECYLVLGILNGLQEVSFVGNDICQFFSMSTVNYYAYLNYLFGLFQILVVQVPQTEVFGQTEMLALIRKVIPSWIIIFKHVGYNWIIVLRNLLCSILNRVTELFGMEKSVVQSVEQLADASLVALYIIRLSALVSKASGSSFCSGAFPSVIADNVSATIALWKLAKVKWLAKWTLASLDEFVVIFWKNWKKTFDCTRRHGWPRRVRTTVDRWTECCIMNHEHRGSHSSSKFTNYNHLPAHLGQIGFSMLTHLSPERLWSWSLSKYNPSQILSLRNISYCWTRLLCQSSCHWIFRPNSS